MSSPGSFIDLFLVISLYSACDQSLVAEHQPVLMLRENKEIEQKLVADGVYNANVTVQQ